MLLQLEMVLSMRRVQERVQLTGMGRLLCPPLGLLASPVVSRVMEFLWLMKSLGWTERPGEIAETGPLCLEEILGPTLIEQSSGCSLLAQQLELGPLAIRQRQIAHLRLLLYDP